MKKLNVLLVVMICLTSALVAQTNEQPNYLENLLGDKHIFQTEDYPIDQLDLSSNTFQLNKFPNLGSSSDNQFIFPTPILPDTELQLTPKGLLDQNGTTYHILIKEPDMDKVVPMPTQKYNP